MDIDAQPNATGPFFLPLNNGYTIYSKSGCEYCVKAKKWLEEHGCHYTIVDCDSYLTNTPERKKLFLDKMEEIIGRPYRTFPMIFKDAVFLGGFSELEKLHTYISFDDVCF